MPNATENAAKVTTFLPLNGTPNARLGIWPKVPFPPLVAYRGDRFELWQDLAGSRVFGPNFMGPFEADGGKKSCIPKFSHLEV